MLIADFYDWKICAFAFLAACSPQAMSENDLASAPIRKVVDATILPLMKAEDIPGMAVAVVEHGQTHFFSFGVMSKANGLPITENTLFEIGSISKTFNATVGALAITQGKMKLNDMASAYLPALRGSALDHVSLLQLATYSAGGFPLQFPDQIETSDQAIAYFRDWKPVFAPGTRRLYSNPSIGLFGYLAAQSMGQDYDQILEHDVLPKLGLTSTYTHVPDEQMSRYAWGYTSENVAVRLNPGALESEIYGIRTSAADLAKYVSDQVDGVNDKSMQEAIDATHVAYFQIGKTYQGMGWESYRYPARLSTLVDGNSIEMATKAHMANRLKTPRKDHGDLLFNKTGSTNGFGAYIAFVPSHKTGVILLANRAYPNAERVKAAYQILRQLDQVKVTTPSH